MGEKEEEKQTEAPEGRTKLRFRYHMQFDYETDVEKYFFTIKAIPCSDARQAVTALSVQLEPPFLYAENTDSFGNRLLYGSSQKPHRCFTYEISGEVEIGQVLFEETADEAEVLKYLHPHGLNMPGSALKRYFASISGGLREDPYGNAAYLMRCLHQDFEYASGVTTVRTGAEEAWGIGKGVCQDYAHIYISLCQMAGIPARYTAGLIRGEGESHAWVEVCCGNKWIGMDPTNNIPVARAHIKFGHGRDADDCQLNRGILYGGGMQSKQIYVSVEEENI